jgi:hypothetical protein
MAVTNPWNIIPTFPIFQNVWYCQHLSGTDDSLEPGSNVTVESIEHSQKHPRPSISTEEGMQIDESDEQCLNTSDSIRKR